MILTVTPQPAVDLTYTLPALVAGATHRVRAVATRAGGKGVNVAAVLAALDEPVLALVPGDAAFGALLTAAGVPHRVLPDGRPVRRTVVAHDDAGATTSLWEPGAPVPDPGGWARALHREVAALLPRARALVVSGSLPPGVSPELPAALAAAAHAAGVPALVDVDGAALRHAAAGGHAVLMPNADELAELLGHRPRDRGEVAAAANELCAGGVPAVVATLGADGMVAATGAAAWSAVPPSQVTGNPTGAGDAAAARVARALAAGAPDWPAVLADAVALSAAAVLCATAGAVDLAAAGRWRAHVAVTPAS